MCLQESVVKDALQYPLSSQNLAAILSILRVLANSSSSRQIEALNYLMEELLLQLEKQANFHLISELVGKVRSSHISVDCLFLLFYLLWYI